MTAVTDELITPTGVLVADIDPLVDRPAWLAVRRLGIGSSDIPAIVESSGYKTKLEVWLDKRGELPDQDTSEAALWGILLEDIVAREWAKRHQVDVTRVGTLAHIGHPWRMANLDRLVTGCPGADACLLEVKTRSAWVAGSWREDVPDDVLAQVQWQLHVTGLPHAHVACLVGGQRLVEHIVDPDPEVIGYIVAETTALWDQVQTGVMPHVDPSALLLDLLDRLHPDRAGAVSLDAPTILAIKADIDAASADEKAAVGRKDAAKATLVALLGPADTVTTGTADDPRVAATYKPDHRTHVDTDQLRADFPAAYAAVVTKKATRPILRFKKDFS